MSRHTVSWVGSLFYGPESREVTLKGASLGVLVGLGLSVATHLVGIGSERAIIKLGFATVAGLAVGEVVIGHRAGSEAKQYGLLDPKLRTVGTTVGSALAIGSYSLQSLWLTMFQANVGAVLIGISLLLGTGWGLGSTREHGRRWNAIRLAGTGLMVVGLAVLIPK